MKVGIVYIAKDQLTWWEGEVQDAFGFCLLSTCHWARSLAADSKNVEESGDHATSLGVWFSRLEATRSSGFRCVNA